MQEELEHLGGEVVRESVGKNLGAANIVFKISFLISQISVLRGQALFFLLL